MAEIVLIQPYTGAWDEMSIRHPESLLAVAAVPAQKGYDVRLIDQRISKSFIKDLEESTGPETIIFGVTAITGQQIKHALKVTRTLKEKYPHIPVCWGGVHATLLPDQTASHPLVDYVVVGDGDLVFCELFERLRDGRPIDDLRGIVYKTKKGDVKSNAGTAEVQTLGDTANYKVLRKNGVTDVIRDLDSLPDLPYHLLNMDGYNVFHMEDGRKSATLNTSRGCPFRCKFCSGPVINEGRWRGFSAKRVIEKVENLYRNYDIRMIYFQDDYFPGPKKRFIEILEGMKKFNREVEWGTLGIRADTLSKLTDEQWDLLYESGCHSLEIGIESGNERVVKFINKGETLEEMRLSNKKLAKYDITVKYTMIIGFPGESEEEIMDTVNFVRELEKENPNAYSLVFPYLPIIGTPFYRECLAAGFEEPKILEEWETMEFDTWTKNHSTWLSTRLKRKMEAINFTSYFHNKNVAYKFGGSSMLRICFKLYHPVAKWRFKTNRFGFFFEDHLKDGLLHVKYFVRNLFRKRTETLGEINKSLNSSEV